MGNESSKADAQSAIPKISSHSEWIQQDITTNDLYGEVKIYRNTKTNQTCALKSQFFQDKRLYQASLKQIQGSAVFDVPSLVKILDIETLEESRTCSNFQKIFITCEYFDKTLEDELQQRAHLKQNYSETDIYQLIDCVLSAMIFLDFRGKEMLQLCPRKILLNHPLYKLTDHQLMTNMSDYQRLMIGAVEQDDWMVAPEVMVEVGKRKFRKPQINNQKAEVFSLGIVCLYMATLIHPKEFKLYDFDRYIVDSEQLDQYIQLFTRMTIYSNQFKAFISQLVKMDPNVRCNFKEVLEKLTEIQSQQPREPREQSASKRNPQTPEKSKAGCYQSLFQVSQASQSPLKKSVAQTPPKIYTSNQEAPAQQAPELSQDNRNRQRSFNSSRSKLTTEQPANPAAKTKQLYNLSKSPTQLIRKQTTSTVSKSSSKRWN